MGRAGVVEVPLNVGLRGDLLAYVLNQAECKAIVIQDEWLPRLDAVAPSLETVRHAIVVGEGEAAGIATIGFREILTADDAPPAVEVAPWDRSVILFTSGTTGPSKGVVLTHNANLVAAAATARLMQYREDDTLFTAFPLFHVNAKYTSVLCSMVLDGGSLVMHDRFSASRFWDICRMEDVNAFNFMGALVMMLQKQPEREDDADNPVRVAYGAPAPVAVLHEFERRFGVELIEVFGSTELAACLEQSPGARRIGSCGRPAPHFQVEIHGEHDNPLGPGVEGEFVVRPREPHVMIEEYYRMPEATLKAFRNFWFHTGDRGRTDEDGWFYFVDRMKDAIRRRGENISTWEVEQVLNDHEAVEESAVVGVPSELTEEEVLAIVKLKDGQELAPEQLLDFSQQRLPHFAVPRYVRFVDELPKNPQQRIQKFVLRDEGLTADTWDRESVGYTVRR
jgi:crotonobetaine/carnitine-CoA ligase